jgi:hypothetical protein
MIGSSIKLAQNTIWESALSKSAVSQLTCYIPTTMIMMLGLAGIRPRGRFGQTILKIGCIATGLSLGLPMSIALFEPNA